jgi:hypothetical protein
MALKKALKKSEDTEEMCNPEGDIISDTMPHTIDSIKSWQKIYEFLDYKIKNSRVDSKNHFRDIAESELHKIAACPWLMEYNDMINWALEKVDILTRIILNDQAVIVGSFRPENIQLIEWWRCPSKFRADTHGIYATTSLNECMVYATIMLCRLFEKKNPCHFPAEWVPFLEEELERYTFNWTKILSDNLAQEISNYRVARSKGQPVSFYISMYIMDEICFVTPFPLMNWSWNITCPKPIHEYHSVLWEENAKNVFYEIFHFIVIPMHKMFYGYEPPLIFEPVSENLKAIVDWFIDENFSYIRVYGCSIPPHALSKFLLDRLVLREVAHQIVKGGIGIELKENQKNSWPIFPVHIGKFSLLNLGHSKVEAEALEEVKLVDIEHRKNEPYQLLNRHLMHCNMKSYEHEKSVYDDIFKEVKTYEEVLNRVRALSPDLHTSFMSFQSHRRSCLPNILQGESTTPPSEQEGPPPGF